MSKSKQADNINKENKDVVSKANKVKKTIEYISTTIISIVFILVIIVCLGIIIQIFSGKKPSFFGYRLYYVLTDSMEPELKVGDVVLSKLTETEEERMKLEVGDIVTFHSTQLQGQAVTHRVYKAPYQKNNQWYIETKGDNAPAVDKPVLLDNVEAKFVKKSNFFGGLYKAFTSAAGAIFLLIIPFALLLASLIIRLIHHIKKPTKKIVVTEEYKEKVIEEYLSQKANDSDYKQSVIDEYLKNKEKSKDDVSLLASSDIKETDKKDDVFLLTSSDIKEIDKKDDVLTSESSDIKEIDKKEKIETKDDIEK